MLVVAKTKTTKRDTKPDEKAIVSEGLGRVFVAEEVKEVQPVREAFEKVLTGDCHELR